MGDTIIITDDEPKPVQPPPVIMVAPEAKTAKTEKVVTEKTTVIESTDE